MLRYKLLTFFFFISLPKKKKIIGNLKIIVGNLGTFMRLSLGLSEEESYVAQTKEVESQVKGIVIKVLLILYDIVVSFFTLSLPLR